MPQARAKGRGGAERFDELLALIRGEASLPALAPCGDAQAGGAAIGCSV